jgi:hypothetical protein
MTPPVEQPVATTEPQPDSVRRAVDIPDEAIAAAVLALAGLGIAGFIAVRRRRRHEEALYDAVYEPEADDVSEAPMTSIGDELAFREPEPALAAPAPVPEGAVPTGEARQQLIAQMAAAPPVEANPFTSYRARRKRARIILQAREHELREQAAQPFDWRTYRPPATHDPALPLVDA